MAIYKFCKLSSSVIVFTLISVIIYALNFTLIFSHDIGAIPAFNEEFEAKVFMRPWYHFNSYLLGVIICIIYKNYLNDKELGQES
jgi:hypothetical protein